MLRKCSQLLSWLALACILFSLVSCGGDPDPCSTITCGANSSGCVVVGEEPACICHEGWAGTRCTECVCEIANGQGSCIDGVCQITSCSTLFASCDGLVSTGCETPLNTLFDCGECGVTCSVAHGTTSCATGFCQVVSCEAGRYHCGPGTGCEQTQPCDCEADDWPDPLDFRDRNCDGVVGGSAAFGVFVSHHGSDSADGTPHRPVRTIARALELAKTEREGPRREVYIAEGEYAGGVMAHVASLYGGYKDLGGGQWDRSDSYSTVINSTLGLTQTDDDVTIELLNIEVPDALDPPNAPGSHGRSAVGLVLAENTGTFIVQHVTIEVGSGSNGRTGLTPSTAPPAASGRSATTRLGAAAPEGSSCGELDPAFKGGDGGDGGRTSFGDAGSAGQGHAPGDLAGAGGFGGARGVDSSCGTAANGSGGGPGTNGRTGGAGVHAVGISVDERLGGLGYVMVVTTGKRSIVYQAPKGRAGRPGEHGGGGGGGGGGGAKRHYFGWSVGCDYLDGGGGGSGGGGGCLGEGGGPGGSGGSSVGIMVRDASVQISNVQLRTNRGGDGGAGGSGADGGEGGSGGAGATSSHFPGGRGGAGGTGGRGGGGAGGAGGHSVGIMYADATVEIDEQTVDFERGSQGRGGGGGGTSNGGPDGVRATVLEMEPR